MGGPRRDPSSCPIFPSSTASGNARAGHKCYHDRERLRSTSTSSRSTTGACGRSASPHLRARARREGREKQKQQRSQSPCSPGTSGSMDPWIVFGNEEVDNVGLLCIIESKFTGASEFSSNMLPCANCHMGSSLQHLVHRRRSHPCLSLDFENRAP